MLFNFRYSLFKSIERAHVSISSSNSDPFDFAYGPPREEPTDGGRALLL